MEQTVGRVEQVGRPTIRPSEKVPQDSSSRTGQFWFVPTLWRPRSFTGNSQLPMALEDSKAFECGALSYSLFCQSFRARETLALSSILDL